MLARNEREHWVLHATADDGWEGMAVRDEAEEKVGEDKWRRRKKRRFGKHETSDCIRKLTQS